ncbi:MAG: aminotransferase class I/II-fold pyridoxal phosphate-dependent enzyme [Clostridia bacterium]|nr:aminotransferase class I/II-fold pyridoxal phosphate-dependent enzyme [Clostridia bacterium]
MYIKNNFSFADNRFLMFDMDELANEIEENQKKEVIRLTLGKSEFQLHQDIIDEMKEATENFSKNSLVFPGGLPKLKKKLSEYYLKQFGVNIDEKNFIIAPGSSSIFRNLFYLLCSEQDEVLIPRPYYSLYRFCALLVGARVRYYDIDLASCRVDMESFRSNFTDKTKIVVINTPGNPLGNVLTDEELYEIDSIVNGKAVIINDEIYSNVYFDEANKSVMNLKDTKSVFITTNAFSKAYRMYTKRIGYCIVPDELVEPLTVIQHHTLLTTDPVVQYGAIKALEMQEEVNQIVKTYKDRRDYTVAKFQGVDLVRPINSQGSFYITLDCSEFMKKHSYNTSFDLAKKILDDKLVATVPGSDFGLPETLRLSYSSKRYKEGIDLLVEFFSYV